MIKKWVEQKLEKSRKRGKILSKGSGKRLRQGGRDKGMLSARMQWGINREDLRQTPQVVAIPPIAEFRKMGWLSQGGKVSRASVQQGPSCWFVRGEMGLH